MEASRARLPAQPELSELLGPRDPLDTPDDVSLRLFCSRLHKELLSLHSPILEATQLETAFNRRDCEEVVLSSIEYVKGFADCLGTLPKMSSDSLRYDGEVGFRQISQVYRPWGTIAAILPQSAFLFLAVTCLLNGLATGNRVILRAPTKSARSADLLRLALEQANPPADSVSVVLTSAPAFIEAVCSSREPHLVHYLGSSAHAPDLLGKCFLAGKQVLIDGEGNTWVWIDEDVQQIHACQVLTSGALRYNGQTCTSVNGVMIHPRVYGKLRNALAEHWNRVTFGNPMESDVEVGPVQDARQAEHCLTVVRESGCTVLAGGYSQGSLMAPTLAAEPDEESLLVSEGLFGPAMWIMPGDLPRFAGLWHNNRYPLCAGILSGSSSKHSSMASLPNLARLVVNGDPSVEHIYEPWGGYPGTGTNPVCHWYLKYLRAVQVDCPA